MIEMMSSTAPEDAPPRKRGTKVAWVIAENEGCVTINRGMMMKLTAMKSIMKRSQRRNEPDAVTEKSKTTAIGTETYGLTPKYSIESEMPMNSVTMMRKFKNKMEKIDRLPQ